MIRWVQMEWEAMYCHHLQCFKNLIKMRVAATTTKKFYHSWCHQSHLNRELQFRIPPFHQHVHQEVVKEQQQNLQEVAMDIVMVTVMATITVMVTTTVNSRMNTNRIINISIPIKPIMERWFIKKSKIGTSWNRDFWLNQI